MRERAAGQKGGAGSAGERATPHPVRFADSTSPSGGDVEGYDPLNSLIFALFLYNGEMALYKISFSL